MTEHNQPITTDARGLKKILGQKLPAIIYFYNGEEARKPLDDALKREAKRRADELLVIRVDAKAHPEAHARYGSPPLPSIVTLTKAFFGRKEKTRAGNVRPKDIRAHIAHLLDDAPLPEQPATSDKSNNDNKGAKHINDDTFRKEVLKSKTPVLVDFWAPWCGPCKALAPFIDKMAQEYRGRVKVVKLNTDQNPMMSRRYQIQSIPTLIMFDGGQPIERRTGGNPRIIRDMIEEALLGR